MQPDLEKRLIVQTKKLQEKDLDAYNKARYLKEEHVTLQLLQGEDYKSENGDDNKSISDESLNEFWKVEGAELEKERKRLQEQKQQILFSNNDKVEIDQKLEQFLNIHSMNLTQSVRNYLEKNKTKKMNEEQTISQLGMIAFERKRFLKALKNVETRFQRRLKEL